MKKLTTLICLMLCVIVGAVYANWTYATSNAAEKTNNVSVTLAEKTTSECGTITVTGAPSFKIEQDNETTKTAKLEWTTPVVTITFTPSSLAPADVVANGISVTVSFTVTGVGDAVNAPTFTIAKTEFTKGDDGKFTATVNVSEKVTVKSSFTLATETDYNTFASAMTTAKVEMKVAQAA